MHVVDVYCVLMNLQTHLYLCFIVQRSIECVLVRTKVCSLLHNSFDPLCVCMRCLFACEYVIFDCHAAVLMLIGSYSLYTLTYKASHKHNVS